MAGAGEGVNTGPPRKSRQGLGRAAILVAAVVAFAGAGWWAVRRDLAGPSAPESKVLAPAALMVAPGLYYLGKLSPGAAYAVQMSDGLVLVDSGLEADASLVTEQLSQLRLDVKSLRAVLLTHAHGDHVLGAARLREMTGAKVYAGRDDCPPIRRGGPREAFFSTFHLPDAGTHATPVDVELTGGEALVFGDARVTALATPGHTPGSVCYLLERAGLRALFTGDVVQSLNRATPGALGTYAAYLPPAYRGNARDYLASLRRLRELPAPDLVLPGHPRMDPTPQSPRLSGEEWHALLDGGIAEMEKLLARYESDGADFLDGTPKELLPGLHYFGDYEGAAVYCLAAKAGLFVFDAPGGPGLVDFLTARFKKLGWEGRKLVAALLTSSGKEATAGLPALVRRLGCKVVVAASGQEAVRRACPAGTEVLGAEELEKAGWFDARVVPLAGRGPATQGYLLRWADKNVLVSGRIPVKPSVPAIMALVRDVTREGGSIPAYMQSLDELARLRPELWLPAVPVHGQNANLYDRDWDKVIEQNNQAFSR